MNLLQMKMFQKKNIIGTTLILLMIIGVFISIPIFASENIKVSNNTLTFDKVIFVDENTGDDTTGDGTSAKPFKTVNKAYTTVTVDNTAIYIVGAGTYSIPNGLQSILKEDMQLTYIVKEGLQGQVKFDLQKTQFNYTMGMLKLNKFIGITFQRSGLGSTAVYEYFYNSATINLEFDNCVFDDGSITPSAYVIYAGNSGDGATVTQLKYTNCAFTTSYSSSGTGSGYLRGTFTNCAFKDTNFTTQTPNLLSAVFDTSYNITSGTWQNVGSGTNPDDSQAHLGVYGGTYAWGVTSTPSTPTTANLDIEAASYSVNGGTEFETYVVINDANNIYAEDINIQYDANLFDFISGTVVDSTALGIYNTPTVTNGTGRYIVASKGEQYGLSGKAQILKLKFKAKNISASGDIKVVASRIANGEGTEFDVTGGSKTFTITSTNGDVNNDGKYTLADLAIAGKLYASTTDKWGTYKPDIDSNGSVEDVDLSGIVTSVLTHETATN